MRRRRGFTLVVVLVMSCALSVLLGQFAVSTLTGLELDRARARSVQLRAAAESGVTLARAMLAADLLQRPAVDSLKDAWALGPMTVRIGEATVTVTIRDENAKIPLPQLLKAQGGSDPRRLTQALRMFTQEAPRDFGVSAADARRWIVANQFRLDLPDGSASGPLFRVSAASPDPAHRPDDCFTVWTDGELNVNTAPVACLRYAWGEDADRFIRALVAGRARTPFTTAQEVLALPGASSALRLPGSVRLSTTSNVFTIDVKAVAGPSRYCEQAVVTRLLPGVPVLYRQAVEDAGISGKPREMTPSDFLKAGA
jgi:type II secretory pathway component PulK